MKKFGFAAVIASGLTAAVIGIAAPAQAAVQISTDVGHHAWVDVIQPQVDVPHVDTSVHQSH
jgi:hypothetical protein